MMNFGSSVMDEEVYYRDDPESLNSAHLGCFDEYIMGRTDQKGDGPVN